MNSVYEIIGVLKVDEICEHYKLPRKEHVTLQDVFIRFDAVERFLKAKSDKRILDAKADIVAKALKRSRHASELLCAIVAICDEFKRIKDSVYQLKDIKKEGMLLH